MDTPKTTCHGAIMRSHDSECSTAVVRCAGDCSASELLRQRAVAVELIAADADAGEATAALARLIDREVKTPEPTDADCRRF